jgi:hypothetical protein
MIGQNLYLMLVLFKLLLSFIKSEHVSTEHEERIILSPCSILPFSVLPCSEPNN